MIWNLVKSISNGAGALPEGAIKFRRWTGDLLNMYLPRIWPRAESITYGAKTLLGSALSVDRGLEI